MVWIKVDTALFRHPKTAGLPPRDLEALVRLWCWCGEIDSKLNENGFISERNLRLIGVTTGACKRLEIAGLLDRNGTGWHIHNWEKHQGALIRRREADRVRVKAWREAHKNSDEEAS